MTNIIPDYEKQMKIIAMAKGFIADDRLASKMEVVISRAMGETPQIAPQDVPLYVERCRPRTAKPYKESNRHLFYQAL